MMKSVRTILPPEWMSDGKTRRVIDALGAGNALFVGGCVRDALMGRTGGDIDIATILVPQDVQEKLRAANIKSIPTGIDHGTVTAIVDGKTFEVTTLRRDVATDGRRAVIAFTQDWAEDAARRDFTVNALYADDKGNMYDPLGQGIADLDARRLRFVGDARARIAEDYLRILRYFRFAAQFGWTLSDEAELEQCRTAASHISKLSRERVTHEMLRILSVENPASVLSRMKKLGILPDLLQTYEEDVMMRLDTRNPLTRLCLLHDISPHLALSNEQKRHMQTVRGGADALSDGSDSDLKRLIYYHGNDMAREIYALWCAQKNKEPQAALLDVLARWQAPEFPLTGEDLIAQGYKPGPELGAEIKRRETEWLEQVIAS